MNGFTFQVPKNKREKPLKKSTGIGVIKLMFWVWREIIPPPLKNMGPPLGGEKQFQL